MKSNRILQIVLLVLIVAFVAVGGFIYAADSKEKIRYNELNDGINKNQAILSKSLTEKAAKEKEAADLESQLASAKEMFNKTNFRASAESIEYDKILFSIADSAKLQVTNLVATPSVDIKEEDASYQLTTFTVSVIGLTPDAVFSSTSDSAAYINAVVTNVLDFVNKVTASTDFDTAAIQSVNITAPAPMTDDAIKGLIEQINSMVEVELKDQIEAMTEKIQTENKDILTSEEIDALIATKTAELIQKTLNNKTTDQVKALVERVNLEKPTATITIKIWTYKGA